MAFQIQLRRGTASEWTSANPTLAAGEFGYESDTSKLKIGDGLTAWSSLAYFSAGSGDMTGVDITAGDGLDITQSNTTSGNYTATVSADLKANGGIVVESTELAVDLGASSITGTLAAADGGTGLTSISTLLNSNTTKGDVGLGNVENTALSTWPGSGNITQVGTISSGTWNGTAIAYSSLSGKPTLGTASQYDVGIGSDDILQANAAVADDDFLRVDGTKIEGRSASEVLSDIGAAASSHNHAAGDITSGTLAVARIPDLTLSKITDAGTAAAAATGDFEASGSIATHNAITTAHGISAFGASLVDDADAAAARTTLGAAASNHTHTLANITDSGTAAALDVGITSNDVLQVATSGVTANEFLRLEAIGTKVTSRTAAEVLSDIGAFAASGVSSFGATLIDDADAAAARTTLGAQATLTSPVTSPAMTGVSAGSITGIIKCSQSQYDAITPDANTLYVIV